MSNKVDKRAWLYMMLSIIFDIEVDMLPQPELGKQIRSLRQEKGESLRTVAHAVGISHECLRRIEKGITVSPGVVQLEGLAKYFGVTFTEHTDFQLRKMNSFQVQIPDDVLLSDEDERHLRMRIHLEFDILRDRYKEHEL